MTTTRYARNDNKGHQYTDSYGTWVCRRLEHVRRVNGQNMRFAYELQDALKVVVSEYEKRMAYESEQVKKANARAAKYGVRPVYSYDSIRFQQNEIVNVLMQRTAARLKKLGYELVYTSDFGSMYFERWTIDGEKRIRISNHAVPMTEEREYNYSNGGRRCANREIIIEL